MIAQIFIYFFAVFNFGTIDFEDDRRHELVARKFELARIELGIFGSRVGRSTESAEHMISNRLWAAVYLAALLLPKLA